VEARLLRISAIEREARAQGDVVAKDADDLRALLRDPIPAIAARAAQAIIETRCSALHADLVAVFRRLDDGEQADAGCIVMQAVVEALSRLEVDAREVYERALAIRRPEPTGSGFVDRAVRVRIEAAHALVTIGDRNALLDIVPLLADPEADVRAGVAEAIARLQSPAAAAVLHLQLLLVSRDRGAGALDLAHACMVGLLRCLPDRHGPTICAYLDPTASDDDEEVADDSFAELAALALAETRIDEALPALLRALEGRRASRFTSNVMLAVASLRRDDAVSELLRIVESENELLAGQALGALRSSGRLDRDDVFERARAISLSSSARGARMSGKSLGEP
jgi:HEAT repeat protein